MVLSEHFILDPSTKNAECNYCGKYLSYKSTSSNLREHLSHKHKDVYNTLPSKHKKESNPKVSHANIPVWEHFKNINTKNMIARCNYCQKHLSYKATISNLKQHLLRPHAEKCQNLLSESPILTIKMEEINENDNAMEVTKQKVRNSYNPLWKYFKRNQVTKISKCYLCGNRLSYKSTTSNLKIHLKGKHINAYNELCKEIKEANDTNVTNHSEKTDDDAEESLRLTDIWNFYEEEAGKARCVVCRASMGTDYEELKAHLKDSHPKLLLQLLQDKDDSDAGSNNGGDDNTYTEIVYLEQEAEEIKPKEKSKYIPRTTPILTRKRERLSVAEEIPVKQKKTDDNDELSIFIKYITCLLKKLPPDAFSQVQIEIINTILKASANANTSAVESPRVILNNELPVTSGTNLLTLNEVQPGNSAQSAHNYTITVATKDGGEIENS